MENWPSLILLGALALLLVAACWFDLRSRTIPNRLNLAIALLALPFWWAVGGAVFMVLAFGFVLVVAR